MLSWHSRTNRCLQCQHPSLELWFESLLLCFQISSLQKHLGKLWTTAQVPVSPPPSWRPSWSSGFLALAWPGSSFCRHLLSVRVPAVPLVIQRPADAPGTKQQKMAQVLGPLAPGWQIRVELLALVWPNSCHGGRMGNEQVDARFLFLSLFP